MVHIRLRNEHDDVDDDDKESVNTDKWSTRYGHENDAWIELIHSLFARHWVTVRLSLAESFIS